MEAGGVKLHALGNKSVIFVALSGWAVDGLANRPTCFKLVPYSYWLVRAWSMALFHVSLMYFPCGRHHDRYVLLLCAGIWLTNQQNTGFLFVSVGMAGDLLGCLVCSCEFFVALVCRLPFVTFSHALYRCLCCAGAFAGWSSCHCGHVFCASGAGMLLTCGIWLVIAWHRNRGVVVDFPPDPS